MRIFTTLLVLLLSSPSVFAETYFCSWWDWRGTEQNYQFIRTTDGFESPDPTGRYSSVSFEIIHEDDVVIVLHGTISFIELFTTTVVQLQKGGENYFVRGEFSDGDSNFMQEGTCTVVE